VLIEGCTLFGDTGANDDTTGIIFDLAGGTAVRDVRVINNSFQTQEVGIYLENSGAAAAYRNISIRGNVFIDEGVSSTVATNQKIGIFADSVSTKSGWVISDNIIRNCNPANTDTVSGDTRAGILIKGSANSNFTVANNAITNIGSGGSELADTMGIRFDSLGSGTVTGNNVDTIRGTNAAGMRFGAGVTAVSNISVTGNRIESITATGAGLRVYGIVWGSASELTITGNTFDSFLVTGGGGAGGAVISADQLGGASTNVSIYNNTCAQSTAGIDSIHIQALNQQRISISGNTFGSGLDRGILLEGPGGGTIDTISISGNSITCGDRCVDTNLLNVVPAASCERISVTGNSFLCTDADSTNIVLSRGQIVTCSGNSCDNTGTHTVTRGQNIFASGTIMFTIISNICRITGGSALNDVNVELTAGCDKFTIVGNIFEGTPAKSIWFSGLVASGQAAFIGLNPGNTAHDDGTGSNIEIVATTPSTGTADMILGAWYV
jgi:hypothetical protein